MMNLNLNRLTIATLAAVVVLLVLGIVYALSGGVHVSGTIPLDSPNGPQVDVVLENSQQMHLEEAIEDANTVNVSTEDGHVTFSSSSTTSLTVNSQDLEGEETALTDIDASGADLTIDPADKDVATIGGGVTSFSYVGGITVDDDSKAFSYSASDTATVEVETDGQEGTQYGAIVHGESTGLTTTTAQADGTVRFDDLPAGTHDISIRELGSLFIRNEQTPHELIDDAEVTVRFFEQEEDNPIIVERTTSTGEIDLTGLPVTEEFVATVRADGYHDRTVIFPDLADQQTAFLINDTDPAVDTIQNRFLLRDQTGNFPPGEASLLIQKSINRSEYGGTPDGYSWTTLFGDDLGASQAITTDLMQGDRYRLIVENEDGDRRILGSYIAETTGTIELDVGRIRIAPADDGRPVWNATYDADDLRLTFDYNDPAGTTERIHLQIHEYRNEDNVLLEETTIEGPFGELRNVENVPDAENETTWIISFTAERSDGSEISDQLVVGPNIPIMAQIPAWLLAFVSIGSIWLVAGLFSQVNGAVGGLVTAGWGAIIWFVGFLPPTISNGVVILALVTAAIIYVRERRVGL